MKVIRLILWCLALMFNLLIGNAFAQSAQQPQQGQLPADLKGKTHDIAEALKKPGVTELTAQVNYSSAFGKKNRRFKLLTFSNSKATESEIQLRALNGDLITDLRTVFQGDIVEMFIEVVVEAAPFNQDYSMDSTVGNFKGGCYMQFNGGPKITLDPQRTNGDRITGSKILNEKGKYLFVCPIDSSVSTKWLLYPHHFRMM